MITIGLCRSSWRCRHPRHHSYDSLCMTVLHPVYVTVKSVEPLTAAISSDISMSYFLRSRVISSPKCWCHR